MTVCDVSNSCLLQQEVYPHPLCYLPFDWAGLTAAAAAAAAATNAAIAEAMKVKKIKLEVMSSYHGNNNHHHGGGGDSENGDLSSSVGKSTTLHYTPVFFSLRSSLLLSSVPPQAYSSDSVRYR